MLKHRSAVCALVLALALVVGSLFAQPAQAAYKGFSDLYSTEWYVTEGWADYVIDNGIIKGYPATGLFEPYGNVTRAEFATMLYRLASNAGKAYTAGNPGFSDVGTGDWYYTAVAWCKDTGIITGYPATGTFEPNNNIKRAEMAVMAYRFAKYMGADMSASSDAINGTEDKDLVTWPGSPYSYSYDALVWTCDKGVLGGTWGAQNGGRTDEHQWLDVDSTATRAQAAKVVTVLYRDAVQKSGSYTVAFNSNGGSSVATQTVKSGQRGTYVTPTRNGYTFMGWYLNSQLTREYTFVSNVTGNITLYAKWEATASTTSDEMVDEAETVEETTETVTEPEEQPADEAADPADPADGDQTGEVEDPQEPADSMEPAEPAAPAEGDEPADTDAEAPAEGEAAAEEGDAGAEPAEAEAEPAAEVASEQE